MQVGTCGTGRKSHMDCNACTRPTQPNLHPFATPIPSFPHPLTPNPLLPALQALLGKAKIMELKKQLGPCLDVLTEINVRFGWFVPALVEKTRMLMMLGDWEQVRAHRRGRAQGLRRGG